MISAIILAAGRGSRMGPLTANIHKSELEFRGQSLLNWQLEALSKAGISNIALVEGYKSLSPSIAIKRRFHNNLWSSYNIFSSLLAARTWLLERPCIISYSDIVYHPEDVKNLVNFNSDFSVAYVKDWQPIWLARFQDPLSDAESFRLNANEEIVEIGKSMADLNEADGQFCGLFTTKPCFWIWFFKRFETDLNLFLSMDMTTFFQWVTDNYVNGISAIKLTKEWFEFDNPKDLMTGDQSLSCEFFNKNSSLKNSPS